MAKRSAPVPGKVRVCNVSFLNSAPYRAARPLDWVEYSETEPAECARRLHEGECDLGCVPIAEVLQHGGYRILDFGIAAEGPVQSVLLLSSQPAETLETIYVDSAAHSSVALLRILLKNRDQNFRIHRIARDEALARVGGKVGALIIGDAALLHRDRFSHSLDLSQLWHELTGLPFVFAVWAGRPEVFTAEVADGIREAFRAGVESGAVFAREWADENHFDREHATAYVGKTIIYKLTERELQGAREFHRRGMEAGIFGAEFPLGVTTDRSVTQLSANEAAIGNAKRTDNILARASAGNRISIADALHLAAEASLSELALAADERREALHPQDDVSYIIDRNINYTNVCNVYCRFCAFYRAPGKSDGYVLSKEQIGKKIEELVAAGGIQILLQGGLNPELGIEYYEELFTWIKSNYPVNLHALSADEIMHISKVSQLSFEETFERLIAAGLGSFPGGGAEILVDRVRQRIARLKTTSSEWLEIHRVAHRLGLRSTCTMMFGVQESWEDRILHLHKLRQVQDETGGFTAFICWPFQPENTKLKAGDTSAPEYLRAQAIARLFLDNISNVQSSWVTMGPSIGQVALFFGANDFGSVMFEENVVSAAGTTYQMDSELIERHVKEAGFTPWRRNIHYQPVGNVVPLARSAEQN
jgi:cyclic dehypoxanthinyl futalosine synthase